MSPVGISVGDRRPWDPDDFEDRLQTAMSAVGIPNKRQLSLRSGISETQFKQWARGTRPRPDILERLAPALELPTARLLIWTGWIRSSDLRTVEGLDDLPVELQQAIELWQTGDRADQRDLLEHQRIVLRAVIDLRLARQRAGRAASAAGEDAG